MAISSPEMMLVPYVNQHTTLLELNTGLGTQIDITEATATNLAADTVLVAHTEILRNHITLAQYGIDNA